MKLTQEQKQAVTTWVADGATLNEIQDRLKTEHGVVLTFMDTRFLLSDLGLTLKAESGSEEEAAPPVAADQVPEAGAAEEDPFLEEEPGAWPVEEGDQAAPGEPSPDGLLRQVQVTVDTVTLPGTMVSGKVTFTDGVKGGWYLDQMGQLGLTGIDRTYQPPEADVIAFQRELQRALR